jgi:hypothetical protein
MTINITDTGVRGYLKWLKQDQPNVYRVVAPVIAQRFPEAFSDHEQSVALGFLNDDAPGVTTTFDPTSSFDTSATSASSGAGAPDVAQAANTGATSPSVANDIANLVTNTTQALSQAFNQYQLTQAQITAVNNINALQAQHMAAGNPPATVSSSSLNIPFISGPVSAATAGTGLGVAILGILGLAFLMKKRRG